MMERKQIAEPLFRYLPWLEQHAGENVSSTYEAEGSATGRSLAFPVYDGTLMNFVRECNKNPLMDRNYRYVYSRHGIKTHDQERKMIMNATWREWDELRGILSYYVLGGRVKGFLWNEAVVEQIFYLVVKKMKELIADWESSSMEQ